MFFFWCYDLIFLCVFGGISNLIWFVICCFVSLIFLRSVVMFLCLINWFGIFILLIGVRYFFWLWVNFKIEFLKLFFKIVFLIVKIGKFFFKIFFIIFLLIGLIKCVFIMCMERFFFCSFLVVLSVILIVVLNVKMVVLVFGCRIFYVLIGIVFSCLFIFMLSLFLCGKCIVIGFLL